MNFLCLIRDHFIRNYLPLKTTSSNQRNSLHPPNWKKSHCTTCTLLYWNLFTPGKTAAKAEFQKRFLSRLIRNVSFTGTLFTFLERGSFPRYWKGSNVEKKMLICRFLYCYVIRTIREIMANFDYDLEFNKEAYCVFWYLYNSAEELSSPCDLWESFLLGHSVMLGFECRDSVLRSQIL